MASPEFSERARAFPGGVLRILQYASSYQPTTIVACDCDARPIGKTLEFLADGLQTDLPSADKSIHYKRISNRLSEGALTNHLGEFFARTASLSSGAQPKILVVDDHVSTGGTMHKFGKAHKASGINAEVRWATYTGRGADFTVSPHVGPGAVMPWRDRPNVLGVRYDEALAAETLLTPESDEFYRILRDSAQQVAGRVLAARTP
jgi:hypothetical protein